MTEVQTRLQAIDWLAVGEAMHSKGFARVSGVLSKHDCQHIIAQYDNPASYRKTVVMERHRFGRGEYKYFDYPLPELVQQIREQLYPNLLAIANSWMRHLIIDRQYPKTLQGLLAECQSAQQLKPTPLILKYEEGGFNTLHQDLYGDIYFPMQAAFLLTEPGKDFSGGEFVLTEQTPRAQSKASVLTLQQGEMLIFTTHFRPAKGARGFYRAPIKHGVSEIHQGQRYTLSIIFHDAVS